MAERQIPGGPFLTSAPARDAMIPGGPFVVYSSAVVAPNITSVSSATPREGATLTITGTNFGASQGAGGATINSEGQTEQSWSDTSVPVTVVLGTLKFGTAYNVALTDNAGTPSNNYAGITGLLPVSGHDYVDVGTPNADPTLRLTASADAVSGDQAEWDTKGGLVVVNDDLTFSVGPGVRSFVYRLWTSGSGYGPWAMQTIGGTTASRMGFGLGFGL